MKRRSTVIRDAKAQEFIIDYLSNEKYVDALDQAFHAQFTAKFGGKCHEAYWGAETNQLAMSLLKSMYDAGELERAVTTLDTGWQPGFPRWVYGYSLKGTRVAARASFTKMSEEKDEPDLWMRWGRHFGAST